MVALFVLGRVILAAFYLYSAFNHFAQLDSYAGYAASKRVPSPKVLTVLTGLLLLIGGLSILLGVYPTVGVVALVLFFVPVTFWMHDFWNVEDAMQRQVQQTQFGKNMALLGSTLMLLAIPQPWPASLGH